MSSHKKMDPKERLIFDFLKVDYFRHIFECCRTPNSSSDIFKILDSKKGVDEALIDLERVKAVKRINENKWIVTDFGMMVYKKYFE